MYKKNTKRIHIYIIIFIFTKFINCMIYQKVKSVEIGPLFQYAHYVYMKRWAQISYPSHTSAANLPIHKCQSLSFCGTGSRLKSLQHDECRAKKAEEEPSGAQKTRKKGKSTFIERRRRRRQTLNTPFNIPSFRHLFVYAEREVSRVTHVKRCSITCSGHTFNFSCHVTYIMYGTSVEKNCERRKKKAHPHVHYFRVNANRNGCGFVSYWYRSNVFFVT